MSETKRNYLADFDLLAVSANLKETDLNVEQTLDTTMLVSKSNLIHLEPRREDNSNEQTGMEEPDTVYDMGNLSNSTLDFEKAQAQHIAFGYAYALGVDIPSAWGTGFEHLITPTPDMGLPSFTGAGRVGKTIIKRRFASLFADTFKVTYAKDSWVKASMGVKGTGKFTDSVTKETISAAYNATTLALAANAVEGADAATRLGNVHRIRVQGPNHGRMAGGHIFRRIRCNPRSDNHHGPRRRCHSYKLRNSLCPDRASMVRLPVKGKRATVKSD